MIRAQEFEAWSLTLLVELGFVHVQHNRTFDAIADYEGLRFAVEVKFTLSRIVSITDMNRILSYLSASMFRYKIGSGILVTSAFFDEDKIRNLGKNFPNIIIWDRVRLRSLVSGNTRLSNELEDFLRDGIFFPDQEADQYFDREDLLQKLKQVRKDLPAPPAGMAEVESDKADELCRKLKSIRAGTRSASAFEAACSDCLRYAFGTHLKFSNAQSSSEDRLRRDLVAKINGRHDFYKFAASDFGTRYLVFEFKNYPKKISQDEIYSTSKYLVSTAFRRIAIIFSPKGEDAGARRAIYGLLREDAKLILSLSTDDLCRAMRLREQGGEAAADVLLEKADEMFLTLSR